MNYKERAEVLEKSQHMNILDVAKALDMDLQQQGRVFIWKEHDSFVFDTKKNMFYWNSRHIGGDAVKLVETIKDCDFNEALDFLDKTNGQEFNSKKEKASEKGPFKYPLKDHHKFNLASDYLENERGISSKTVTAFHEKGLISQASYKNYQTGQSEPVIVFKNYSNGKIAGMAVQGVWKKGEYGKRQHLKKNHGDGLTGFKFALGDLPSKPTKENPLRIFAFEAPIDLMSFYDLFASKFQANNQNILLVAMNGLKKGAISEAIADVISPNAQQSKKPKLLDYMDQNKILSPEAINIALAVDNDEAGSRFITDFGINHFQVKAFQPKLIPGSKKTDWNDLVKLKNEKVTKSQSPTEGKFATHYRATAKKEGNNLHFSR